MTASPKRRRGGGSGFVRERIAAWRSGSTRSQVGVLAALLVGVAASLAVSIWNYSVMPLSAYVGWLLLGGLVLRFWPMVALCAVTLAAGVVIVVDEWPLNGAKTSTTVVLAISVLLLLLETSRQRSGLPGLGADTMLADLRDRLQAQAKVPPLPDGWASQSAMRPAHGAGYAGDFLVADLDEEQRLEMILVDVCGKGMDAAPQALQFAGALGGLIGCLPPQALLEAANGFLLRQFADDAFATAVHVVLDLRTGAYSITSAGHPPALHWVRSRGEWEIDNARGTALGVMSRPQMQTSTGRVEPGEALMFYTDGVVESRTTSFDDGLAWLRATARAAVADGFAGAAARIIRQVPRGDDDRAVLILSRDA